VNVSPLEYGHVLIVPDINALRPQVSTYCYNFMIKRLNILAVTYHQHFMFFKKTYILLTENDKKKKSTVDL